MVGGFVTTSFVTTGTTGVIDAPPPPPPHHPPQPPPPLFVVAENVAKVVKCFVQIARSEPTVIMHSPSTGRASQTDWSLPVQSRVISVKSIPVRE